MIGRLQKYEINSILWVFWVVEGGGVTIGAKSLGRRSPRISRTTWNRRLAASFHGPWKPLSANPLHRILRISFRLWLSACYRSRPIVYGWPRLSTHSCRKMPSTIWVRSSSRSPTECRIPRTRQGLWRRPQPQHFRWQRTWRVQYANGFWRRGSLSLPMGDTSKTTRWRVRCGN